MRMTLKIAGVAMAISLGGCGDEASRGGLTAEEDRMLNNAATMLDDDIFDTSADSLVANEAELEGGAPGANAAGNDADGNVQ